MTTNPGNPKHPRADDHCEFIARVSASVSSPDPTRAGTPPVTRTPTPRPDQGRAVHSPLGNPSGRGPHN
jgi:hypothetical protein